jgi:hypothetical protein
MLRSRVLVFEACPRVRRKIGRLLMKKANGVREICQPDYCSELFYFSLLLKLLTTPHTVQEEIVSQVT